MRLWTAFSLSLGLLLAACATTTPTTDATVVSNEGWAARHAAGEAAREQVRFAADPLPDAWSAAPVTTSPVPINDPALESGEGRLRYAGGVEIHTDFSRLHGLSDIVFVDDTRFYSISDEGLLVRGRIQLDGEGRLVGVTDVQARPLLDPDGQPLIAKYVADAEGLARQPDGQLLVAFERDHRVWRYDPETGRMLGERVIPTFAFTENEGMEGIAAAGDVMWAAGEGGGLWACGPVTCSTLMAPPEVAPVDADLRVTSLQFDDQSGLYVLERAYDQTTSSTTVRISHWGGVGPFVPLATLQTPSTVDNFEGIGQVAMNGRARLYILSDDNFSEHQRTLLLAFDVVR